MPEIWFYQLARSDAATLVLSLLRRGLDRGLRLSVQTRSATLIQAWSALLWSVEDTGFLAHGQEGDSGDERLPILLTASAANANCSQFRFYVDGALPVLREIRSADGFSRASIVFAGDDAAGVAAARGLWKEARDFGLVARYQCEDAAGTWNEAVPSAD
jgi:DNA polymerase-3 subunit chi